MPRLPSTPPRPEGSGSLVPDAGCLNCRVPEGQGLGFQDLLFFDQTEGVLLPQASRVHA
jgi:hypothetical protein